MSTVHRVLVAGVPRGSTTWVGQVLARTDGTVYVHEPDGTADPFAFVAKVRMLHHPMLDPGDREPQYERLWTGAFAGGRLAGTPRDRAARRIFHDVTRDEKMAARLEGRRSARVRAIGALAVPRVGVPDARHVVVKSVNSAFSLEWLTDRFAPDVVVVTRHPLNVVASWSEFGWNAPEGPMYRAIAARAAQRWEVELPPPDASTLTRATAVSAALSYSIHEAQQRHPEWVTIAHEDACLDPLGAFRSVAERVGLTWSDRAEEFLRDSNRHGEGYATRRVAAEQPDRWRSRLEPDQIAEVLAVLDRFPPVAAWSV